MLRAMLTLLLVFVETPAKTQAQYPFKFAGIEDSSTVPTIRSHLSSAGFVFKEIDRDGDFWFTGNVMSTVTDVVVIVTPTKRVAKIIVNIRTPDDMAKSTYAKMVTSLKEKYGEPETEREQYDPPYEKGDGYEQQAIRLGKADFTTYWISPGNHDSGLLVKISKSLSVYVIYEYPVWTKEADRRRVNETKVF